MSLDFSRAILHLKKDELNKAIAEAFTDTVYLFARENTQVISEVGAFSTHPTSDIVDTGRLRASQWGSTGTQMPAMIPTNLNIDTQNFTAELSWNTDYALYVNQGYVNRNGKVIEGRPWHELAQRRFDLPATFEKLVLDNIEQKL